MTMAYLANPIENNADKNLEQDNKIMFNFECWMRSFYGIGSSSANLLTVRELINKRKAI